MRQRHSALRTFLGGATGGRRPRAAPVSGCRRRRAVAFAFLLLLIGAGGAQRAAAQDQATRGEWGAAFDWGRGGKGGEGFIAVHMAVLPNGRVLSFPAYKSRDPQVWDPRSGGFTPVPVPYRNPEPDAEDIFCSGHAFLPDGRLLVAGGQEAGENGRGTATSYLFDYRDVRTGASLGAGANPWTRSGDMTGKEVTPGRRDGRRWYPTCVTLPGGQVLVAAGSIAGNPPAPGADPPGIFDETIPVNDVVEVWQNGSWSLRGAPGSYDAFYPWLHVAPDGRLFYAGPAPNARYLNPATGELAPVDQTEWGRHRRWGASVLYDHPGDSFDGGRVLILGGTSSWFYADDTQPPADTAEVIDLNQANPAWRNTQVNGAGAQTRMHHHRKHHNATLLPDGRVLITGGTSTLWHTDVGRSREGNVRVPELWDPATEQFTEMAPLNTPVGSLASASETSAFRTRAYHSTAVLLPDARVLVAGGDWMSNERPDGENPPDEPDGHEDGQIFSPPYLFNADGTGAARPSITGISNIGATDAPGSLTYDAEYDIRTPEAAAIRGGGQVSLIGLSSVTHSFNAGQRINRLSITASFEEADRVRVRTPADANRCPPGYYLLFVLRPNPQNGGRLVPSEARIIRIG